MANALVKSLRRVGGGTPELDRPEVSQKTRNGYTVLGMLVLIVATMSSAIAGFTWASVMHSVAVGVGVACAWFLFSASLNYMMAWIIDAARGRLGGLLTMTAAILLFGMLISAVNTNFVLLWMMDPEIKQTLQANYQADRAALEAKLNDVDTKLNRDLTTLTLQREAATNRVRSEGSAELAKTQAEVTDLTNKYQIALNAVTVEVDGRANSKQIGDGARAKQKRAEAEAIKGLLDAANARLAAQTARLDPAVQGRIAEANRTYEVDKARLQDEAKAEKNRTERNIKELDLVPRDGFVNRDLALWGLVKQDPHFMFIFMALFFLIESLVALVKILMGKTDYLLLLEAMAADKLRELAVRTANSNAARRAAELTSRQQAAAHRKQLHQLDTEEHNDALAQATARHKAIEDHLKGLADAGVSEEAIDAMRSQLLKEEKHKFGTLRLVAK